jgi:DNA-directed RNA polymerase specialized sigma24 family protein
MIATRKPPPKLLQQQNAPQAELAAVLQELRTSNRLLAVIAVRNMVQRDAILLLDAVGLQPSQIAQAIGITPNAARVALHRARRDGADGVGGRGVEEE